MWITLPIAVLTFVVLAARGRPWHGLVAGTVGFYVMRAAWALLASGTGGFTQTISSASWWQPTLALGLGAIVTGVPPIRTTLFGRRSWARDAALTPAEIQSRLESTPEWQTTLLDAALDGRDDAWDAASSQLVDEENVERQVGARGYSNSMAHRVSGALGQAIKALDECLDSVCADARPDGPSLSGDAWTRLLALDEASDKAVGPGDAKPLSITDRAELVLRASSHSVDAGLGLAWRWFSGLDELVDHLGTEEQKAVLGSPGSHRSRAGHGEILAAGWTGHLEERATAIVTKADHGSGDVLGLRLNCRIDDVVGAGAATLVAVLVRTEDPEQLLGNDHALILGRTCVLLRPGGELSMLNGAAPAERLASQPLRARIECEDTFIGLPQILGGEAGIGTINEEMDRIVAGLHAAGTAALLAGQAQRLAAIEGSSAILHNVMNGETIEAWSHADLGSLTLRSTAIARTSALVLEERTMHAAEAFAFGSAATRIVSDLRSSLAHSVADERSSAATPGPWLPPFEFGDATPWTSGWMPGWYRSALEAVREPSPARHERARARGLRELLSSATRAALEIGLRPRTDRSRFAATDVNAQFGSLARTHAVLRTAALRANDTVLDAHLSRAAERLTVCAALAVVDRLSGSQPVERHLFEFAALSELVDAAAELEAASGPGWWTFDRLVTRFVRRASRRTRTGRTPALAESVATSMAATPEILRRLTADSYPGHATNGGTAPIRQASRLAAASRVPIHSIQRAQSVGQLPDDEFQSVLDLAVARRIASAADVAKIRACMAVASEFVSRSTSSTPDQDVRRSA